jgi:hypothetical protein
MAVHTVDPSNEGISTGRGLEGSGHGEMGDPIVRFVWRD